MTNLKDTLLLFHSLGFVVHLSKSVLVPTKQIQYLGVVIDSESMKVTLTMDRLNRFKAGCQNLLKHHVDVAIREVTRVIGLLVASFPAVKLIWAIVLSSFRGR